MDPELFDEWMAFDAIEGVGLERIERIMALGFCTLANALRSGEPLTPEHFLLGRTTPKREQTPEEQLVIAQQIADSMG